MNNMLMMLLPLLSGQKLSPEMLTGLLGNNSENAAGGTMGMIMSMMSKNGNNAPSEPSGSGNMDMTSLLMGLMANQNKPKPKPMETGFKPLDGISGEGVEKLLGYMLGKNRP